MPPPRTSADLRTDEQGSAALEFIFTGVILLVPIVYLVVVLGLVQGQAMAVESAARHIARAVATAEDAASADARAVRVRDAIIAEYGMDPEAVHVAIECTSGAGECPSAGRTLAVRVTSSVPLPLVPPILGLDQLAQIGVEATSLQKVSRFWSGG